MVSTATVVSGAIDAPNRPEFPEWDRPEFLELTPDAGDVPAQKIRHHEKGHLWSGHSMELLRSM
jgi:hypothetical protein